MSANAPRVLAVEDDVDFRRALETVLKRFGLVIEAVPGPAEFLDRVNHAEYDLYLIDLQLGEADGLNLIDELKAKRKCKTPIVVVSGVKHSASIAHALEIGADDYITKPLDRTFLASKLSRFLKTDQIDDHRSAFQELPQGRVSAKLTIEGKITEVDELGIHFLSRALIPKGTSFKVTSDLFPKFGSPGRECLVTVASTWLDTTSQLYGHYAEFDGLDTDFLQKVRRWIMQT